MHGAPITPRARRWTRPIVLGAAALALAASGVVVPAAIAGAAEPPAPASPEVLCTPTTGEGSVEVVSGGFHSQTPQRVLDTRTSVGFVGAGCTAVVDLYPYLTGQATGVALGVVAVDAAGAGYVTVFPCDAPQPTASNVNTRAAVATPNAVTVPLGATRRVCLYTSVATQLVVDLTGWFGPGGDSFHGLDPERLLDTRPQYGGDGSLQANNAVRIRIAGRGGVPGNASGVAINLTVTNPVAAGFITAYPCDDGQPPTSSGNYLAGETRAVAALIALDDSGDLCVFTQEQTDLIVDLSGWFGGKQGTRYEPIVATRVVDSRDGTGGWVGPLTSGSERSFDPTAGGRVPVGANALLDVVATGSTGPGYLTVYPCGTERPPTSSLNYTTGQDVPNFATIQVGTNGRVCVYASQSTDVVIDVLGSFGPGGALRDLEVEIGGTPTDLRPAFSPDAHDYGVPCAAGSNELTIMADAIPGAVVDVVGDDGSGGITVDEGDLVDILVTPTAADPQHYYVRCLPHDFPPLTVERPDDPAPGYYLVTAGGQGGGTGAYVIILDTHGAAIWYQPTGTPSNDFKLLPDGKLAWVHNLGIYNPLYSWAGTFGQRTVAQGGFYEVRELDGTLVRTWATNGVGVPGGDGIAYTDHHDMQILPNGNALMLSYHRRTGVDIGVLGAIAGVTHVDPAAVLDAWIQEIDKDTGDAVWTWKAEDHIGLSESIPAKNVFAFLDPSTGGPGANPNQAPTTADIDINHINSVEFDPDTGNLLISNRHNDAVYLISDPATTDGHIIWKLGGNTPTEAGAKHLDLVGDTYGGPKRQHDARFVDGTVVMYDDQSPDLPANTPCSASARAVQYAIDPADGANGTATLVWQWRNPNGYCAAAQGGARRQADGSVVIAWGNLAPATTPNMTDVERWGNLALQVTATPPGSSYRVVKVAPDTFDPAQLRATAGLLVLP